MKETLAFISVILCSLTLAQATRLDEVASTGEEHYYTNPTQRLRLTGEGPDPLCSWQMEGLADPEPKHRWSCAEIVTFKIPTVSGVQSVLFENITANGPQKIKIYVAHNFEAEYQFNQQNPQQSILVSLKSKYLSSVMFVIDGACMPGNGDTRKLGLAFRTLALFDVPDPVLKVCPAIELFPKDLRKLYAARVKDTKIRDSFPVAKIQQFKEALNELEQALNTFAIENGCNVADILDEADLVAIQNGAVIADQIISFVGQLENQWKAADTFTVNPNVIGSMLWEMFGNDLKYATTELEGSFKGNLLLRWKDVEKQFLEYTFNQTMQKLEEIVVRDEEPAKQSAFAMMHLVPALKEFERRREMKEPLTQQDFALYEENLKSMSKHMAILNLKIWAETMTENYLADHFPIASKYARVCHLAKDL